jgi:hypothetical protein
MLAQATSMAWQLHRTPASISLHTTQECRSAGNAISTAERQHYEDSMRMQFTTTAVDGECVLLCSPHVLCKHDNYPAPYKI